MKWLAVLLLALAVGCDGGDEAEDRCTDEQIAECVADHDDCAFGECTPLDDECLQGCDADLCLCLMNDSGCEIDDLDMIDGALLGECAVLLGW